MKTTDLLGENISLVTPTKVTEPDHEVQMARSDLYKAGKYAIDLHNMLKTVGEAHGLEGWVQAKITKAADYLESVYHYLDYEMKSRGAMAEGAPTGPSGPIPPGAVPVGGAVGPSVAPAQAAAMAAKGRIDQKKAIEAKIKDLEMQKQQLQRQLAQAGQVQETTSAGAIASSMGGNGLGKSKSEVGSLFGGTYKTKKKLKEAPHSNAPRLSVVDKHLGTVAGPDVEHDKQKIRALLTQMMGKLPAKYERVLRMRFFQDMTLRQIADKFNLGTERIRQIEAKALRMLKQSNRRPSQRTLGGALDAYSEVNEAKAIKQRLDPKCWTGKHKEGTKIKGGVRVNNCVPNEGVEESANTLFDVKVIDPKTGNEKTMEISALTATEAKSKVAGKTVDVDGEKKHYKVLSVKSAWAEAANPAKQAAIAIAKKKSGKYDKEGKRIKEDDDLDHVIGIRNKMNAATDPAEKSRLQQQYDMVTSTFSRIPPTSFPATDQPAKQDQPTSEEGNPINKAKKGASMESSIGPKFTGYYKGTDKGKPGKKMVGGD